MENMEAAGRKEFFVEYFFCSGINAECFFPFVSLRHRQSDEETSVDGSGNVGRLLERFDFHIHACHLHQFSE